MENDDVSELFEGIHENVSKPFSHVFKIEQTEFGLQIISLEKTKVNNIELDLGKSVMSWSITLDNRPITDFQDKMLTGYIHKYSRVFTVTGYSDIPPKD